MTTGSFDRSLRPRWKVIRNQGRQRIGAAVLVILVGCALIAAYVVF